jgi:hypothetical protein
MRFARGVFGTAGVWGLAVMIPMFFLESYISHTQPPPITHPEFFYGFAGVTFAWQILFLLIARDPVRLRPAMPAGVVEKLAFAVSIPLLVAAHRVDSQALVFAAIDGLFAVLFVAAYLRTPVS